MKGNSSKLFDLLFLDQNWEIDWWNKKPQAYFLNEDLALAKQRLTENNNNYKLLKAYIDIKKKKLRKARLLKLKIYC